MLSLARTLFLVLLLAAGSYFIHRDTRRLVLRPVERMVGRVREMAEDPLMQVRMKSGKLIMPQLLVTAIGAGWDAYIVGRCGREGGDRAGDGRGPPWAGERWDCTAAALWRQ